MATRHLSDPRFRPLLALLVFSVAALPRVALAQSDAGWTNEHTWLFILAVFGLVYIIPSVLAFWRGHPNRWVIAIINVVFGGTLLGWLAALVWAMSAVHRSDTGNHGGESGLNIFANDVQTVRLEAPAEQAAANPSASQPPLDSSAQLKQLKQLFEEGLDEDEYSRLKDQVLDRMMLD